MASVLGFELGPHWWEVIALTTGPATLAPQTVLVCLNPFELCYM